MKRNTGDYRPGTVARVLVDDEVCLTNLNRQIIATRKTVGKYKVAVIRNGKRALIDPVNARFFSKFGVDFFYVVMIFYLSLGETNCKKYMKQ